MQDLIEIYAPPSKSYSHRNLIAAALAKGESVVHNVLESEDIKRTRIILQSVGAEITPLEPLKEGQNLKSVQSWKVVGKGSVVGGKNRENAITCDVGESGTSCRLLTALLASGQGYFHLVGAERMYERPIGALVKALRKMGASVEMSNEMAEGEILKAYPPLLIGRENSNKLQADRVEIALDESSQYLSGLLLSAPLCEGNEKGEKIFLPVGKKVVSFPYVALTLQILEDFGVNFRVEYLNGEEVKDWKTRSQIEANSLCIKVLSGSYKAGEYFVEGDWSNASYLLAAGVIGKKAIEVKGLRLNSLQGDISILDIMQKMGVKFSLRKDSVIVQASEIQGIEIDMNSCPDIVPTVAVLAAHAEGITHIKNIEHLRVKECDRISAVASELRKLNIKIDEQKDSLTIHGEGNNLNTNLISNISNSFCFDTYNDHRLAMSMSLFTLHGKKLDFNDKNVVTKSFPNFWETWNKILKGNGIEYEI